MDICRCAPGLCLPVVGVGSNLELVVAFVVGEVGLVVASVLGKGGSKVDLPLDAVHVEVW